MTLGHARRRTRPARKLAAVATITALTVALTCAPATANPTRDRSLITGTGDLYQVPGMTPQVMEEMKVQERLDRLADEIRGTVKDTLTSGLAGIAADTKSETLIVYWHGTLSAELNSVLAGASRHGVSAIVRPAPYTQAQLIAEADRMSRQPLFYGAKQGQRTMRVHPRPDGTGLEVGISGLPTGVTADQARKLVPALNSSLPLSVTTIQPVAFTSRFQDVNPWWGGAFMQRGGAWCSNAFGVRGNNGAATYLLTAAHCGEGTWRTGNVNGVEFTYGDTIPAGRATDLDAALILTPLGAGNGVYWGRGINPPAGDTGATSGGVVSGSNNNVVFTNVCASGAFSGTVCGAAVQATDVTIVIDPPTNGVGRITNLVWATKTGPASAVVGNGDSGGPVVSVGSDGRLIGRGIVSAIDTGDFVRPCEGWQFEGRICSYSFYFADLRTAMNRVGVQLNTG